VIRKITCLLVLFLCSFYISVSGGEDETIQKAVQLFKESHFAKAKEIFQSSLKKDPNNSEAAFYLGRIYLVEDSLEKSIKYLKEAAVLDGNSSENHHWLGIAYGQKAQKAGFLKKAGLAKKMKKEIERALELDPDNVDAHFSLMQYYLYAPGFMGGSVEKAREQAEEIKKRAPQQGHRAFVLIYEKEKKYYLAEKEYLSMIDADPENLILQYEIGYWYQRTKQYDKAFRIFETILKMDPEEMNAYYQIGRTAALSGKNLSRGAECLKKYLQTPPEKNNPSFAWAHYRLGMIYEKGGKLSLAKQEYQITLSYDVSYEEAKKALKRLK